MKLAIKFFSLLLITALAFGCEKEVITPDANTPTAALNGIEDLIRPDVQCGTSRFSDIKNNNGDLYGTVEILNDADYIYMLIEMEHGKFLDAIQVYFGDQASIPNNGTNIVMEDFQFQAVTDRGATRYTVIMPHSSLSSCSDIVLWAQASERNMFGNTTSTSVTWMSGIAIYDGSFFKYCLGSCGSNFNEDALAY
jgi:hypothetical protein